jgi:hypothetical protein
MKAKATDAAWFVTRDALASNRNEFLYDVETLRTASKHLFPVQF